MTVMPLGSLVGSLEIYLNIYIFLSLLICIHKASSVIQTIGNRNEKKNTPLFLLDKLQHKAHLRGWQANEVLYVKQKIIEGFEIVCLMQYEFEYKYIYTIKKDVDAVSRAA